MKMKTNLMESRTLRYESPDVAFVDVAAEGILCVSGENDDQYKEEVFPW